MASTQKFTAFANSMLAKSVCTTAVSSCNGKNVQHESTDQCVSFLINELPCLSAYHLGFNILLCSIAPIGHTVPCSHIGPSGGDYYRDDRTHRGNVQEPVFTKQPFMPYRYANSDATVSAQ